MPLVKKLILLFSFLTFGTVAFAAEGGVSAKAEELFYLGPLPVTNSMVTSWIVAVALIIAIRFAIRSPKLIPSRSQAVVEAIVEGVRDLIAPIVGKDVVTATFPLLVALFIFILTQNWSGLIPGVGTLRYFDGAEWKEILRPGNADMNGTLALALVSFVCWIYFIMRYAGPAAVLQDIFGNKADRKEMPGFIYYLLFVVFFGVGIIEVISILFRPISLSLRLYGNVFGGENLLHAMSGIMKWGLPIPFYFLELLIGIVQALVFTLLVSVYIGLICNHGDDNGDDHGHAGHNEAAH